MQKHRIYIYLAIITFLLFIPAANAQQRRITTSIDNNNRLQLRGHIQPRALPEEDQGSVDPSLTIPYVTVQLKLSAAQQADLDQLLIQQQDPASPNFHHWLTPEQYGDRFGANPDDIAKLTAWLESQHLTVTGVARSRTWVAFSGTAAQVQSALGVEMHYYLSNGKKHFANANEPSIPVALAGVIGGFHGLNDFHLKPAIRSAKILSLGIPSKAALQPKYDSKGGNHYLAPDDFAAIYDVSPLYATGIDGTGQSLVVVGQTQINLSDLQAFRAMFGLSGGDPQIVQVPGTKNPGVVSGDIDEADLDLEWSAAVARGSRVTYVFSDDVITSLQYSIDQNVAPVLSMSYGSCEPETPSSDAATMQQWAKQGNAQGMTWFAASGDSGGTDCYDGTSKTPTVLSVDVPAAIPEVTGIGATTFSEGTGKYWATANNATDASVLSYIPEVAWNDSTAGDPGASGGGASVYFAKPYWQSGAGVPNDGARDVPDVSLSGSADHDGYLVYSGGSLEVIGGTSCGAPSFAGIATLMNHYLMANGVQAGAGLGNINPKLYSMAQTASSVFHDITVGNNIINITCTRNGRNCTPGSFGYNAGPGYDQVTGLGTVDVFNLARVWAGQGSAVTKGTATLVVTSSASSLSFSGNTLLTATVKSSNGGTPTGVVTFSVAGVAIGTATLAGSGGTATATLTVDGPQFAAGVNTVNAQYNGDSSYSAATASVSISVTSPASGPPSISNIANGASFAQAYAPGGILSIFGSSLAPTVASAANVPLPPELAGVTVTINGITAPLYYVSATQLNVQIPYETPVNSAVTLSVSNNGQSASMSFLVSSAAPGIFVDGGGNAIPTGSIQRGQVATLFITGAGAVSPAVGTGAAPASGTATPNLPAPVQNAGVTVGGVNAPIQFIGIPVGLVGVVQINYLVPSTTPVGTQQVAVSIGNISSPSGKLNVTQ